MAELLLVIFWGMLTIICAASNFSIFGYDFRYYFSRRRKRITHCIALFPFISIPVKRKKMLNIQSF